jgi:lysophospholipase L1-like esterase
MERNPRGQGLIRLLPILVALGAAPGGIAAAQGTADLPPLPRECGDMRATDTLLPNSAVALQKRKQIRILAIGASSAAVLGGTREGRTPLLEKLLERGIKGLDVEIVDRGFSGELAEAAGSRLKVEVALTHPDIVLWQVGTNDALAQVPVERFQVAVSNTVRWLKEHNIDVILVGLHYVKPLAKDAHYQAIRASLRRVSTEENVLRVGRYEAMEVISRTLRDNGSPDARDFGFTEAGYNCMAQFVARAIAVGLYAKAPKPPPTEPVPTR